MPQLSTRQQVRQETRNSQGEYATYDAAPSNASLDTGVVPDGGWESLADRHGVEIDDPETNPLRVHGRTQDIRALALDMEREHGVSTEVRAIHRGGTGVEDEDYPLDGHVDPDREVEADIYHREVDSDPIDDIISEASVEGTHLRADEIAAQVWEDNETNLPSFTTAEAQQRLTQARNAGILLRNSDGSYNADLAARPPVEGERISAPEALNDLRRAIDPGAGSLTTGHRMNVGTWVDRGDETAEPKTREMVIDDAPDTELKLVNDDPRGGEFDVYTVPLTANETETGAEPRITRSEDGTITVEVDEEIDGEDVIPGQRFTLTPAQLTDDYTAPRTLTDGQGRESPFDVGPTRYEEDPDYGDRVTLTRTVHNPDGQQLGRVYQGDQRQWVIDYGGGDMEDPAFDTAEEAAEHLYRADGGRGNWSKPTAENVPMFALD